MPEMPIIQNDLVEKNRRLKSIEQRFDKMETIALTSPPPGKSQPRLSSTNLRLWPRITIRRPNALSGMVSSRFSSPS